MGRRRSYLLVAVGLLLLANGLYAHLLVPEGHYRFGTAAVGEDPDARVHALEDADVLVVLPDEGWSAVLRAASRDTEGVAEPAYRAPEGDLPLGADSLLAERVRYASVDGRLYLVGTDVDDAGVVTIRAARTTPARALDAVAVTPARLSGHHARAFRTGGIERVRRWTVPEDRIVRTDRGYVLVSADRLSRYDESLDLLILSLYPAGYVVLLWGLVSHPALPPDYRIAPAGPR